MVRMSKSFTFSILSCMAYDIMNLHNLILPPRDLFILVYIANIPFFFPVDFVIVIIFTRTIVGPLLKITSSPIKRN